MALTPVVIDFESFWSPTYSLSRMNRIEYVMHPETGLICISVKIGGSPRQLSAGRIFPPSLTLLIGMSSGGADKNLDSFGDHPCIRTQSA